MDPAVLFQTIIIPFGLFLVMMGLGLTLSIDDILRVIIMPKAVLTGLAGQLILLPLVAFGLAFVMNPAPVIAIGLILLAACPGGITSNAYVFASRGDIALSVTLTTVASLFTVVTMPLLAWLALDTFAEAGDMLEVPVGNMMRSLAQLTVLPIGLGMTFRKFKPAFAERMVEPVRKMALGILIMVIITNTYFSIDTLKQYMVQAGVAALVLNVVCMSMGYGLTRVAKLNVDQTISITYEVGLQNLSLALVLANTLLGVPDYAAVTLIYGFFMKFTALSFMAYAKKLKGIEKAESKVASV
ncbi:MAG: bile acid:sodium symporter family protein [Pseudohongiellaceae bacterium]